MNADDVTSGRQPLLRPDGQWDHVALAAWFQDDACWKAVMPDDDFSFLGPRAGDLIITDDSVDPYIGGLMLLLDEEHAPAGIGLVDRDFRGRICIEAGSELLPVEDEHLALGQWVMVVGFLQIEPGRWPTLKDLFRAQTLPLEMLPQVQRGIVISPHDIPF